MYNCVYRSIVSFGSFLSKFVIQCTLPYSNSFTLETAAFAELGARLCLKSISCRVAPKQAHQIDGTKRLDMQNAFQGGDPNGIVQNNGGILESIRIPNILFLCRKLYTVQPSRCVFDFALRRSQPVCSMLWKILRNQDSPVIACSAHKGCDMS